MPPSIPFYLAPSAWSQACDRTANEAVTELDKYCKANPGVPEHRLVTNDTCDELQRSLMKQFDEQMRQSWQESIRPQDVIKANCDEPNVQILRIEDSDTEIQSTNLAAEIKMRVVQKSQKPNKGPDLCEITAIAAARVAPDGSIDYSNCYSVTSKSNPNTGRFDFIKKLPPVWPSSSTAPPNYLWK